MNRLQVLVVGMFSLLVVACGGGGGGGSDESDREADAIVQYEPGDVASLAVINTEATLQLGQTMVSIVELLKVSDTGQIATDCGAYGDSDSKIIRLLDNDGDNTVSAGDRVEAQFSNCFVNTMNGNLGGRVDIEIFPGQIGDVGPDGVALFAVLDGLKVDVSTNDVVELLGEINVTYFSDEHIKKITVRSVDELQYHIHDSSDVYVESLSQFSISRELNDYTAKYAIQVSGYARSSLLESEYEITTTQDVVGYFNMVPFDGILTISDKGLGRISISPSSLDEFWEVGHRSAYEQYQWIWDAEGAFWWNAEYCGFVNCTIGGVAPMFGVLRGPELGGAQSSPVLVSPVGFELHYQLSKEIDVSRLPSGLYLSQGQDCCEGAISLRVEAQGAVLKLIANSLLLSDTLYRLGKFNVFDLDGAALEISGGYLKSKEVIDANISASRATLVPGELLELDASGSMHSEADIVSYKWRELTNTGIVFENTNQSRTNISSPALIEAGTARIELTVTDAIGNFDVNVTEIYLRPTLEDVTYFSFFSEAEDPVGKGATKFIAFNADDVWVSGGNSEIQIYSKTEFGQSFGVFIAAPTGQRIASGLYQDTTLTHDSSKNRLEVSYDFTGCGPSTGWFEVKNIVRGIGGELLALDVEFEQTCANSSGDLRGVLQYRRP